MYTAYVNDCPLRIAAAPAVDKPPLTLRYQDNVTFLLQVISTLEGGSHKQGVLLLAPDPGAAWAKLKSLYKLVPAAGGAVLNEGRLLCIYRRGSWDLPKGKIDEGEGIEEAAVREVQEETGLQDVRIARELPTTYHTYKTKKGKRVLKPTYWFEMVTAEEALVPQAEEDIEEARWVAVGDLAEVRAGMYASLRGVVDTVG